MARHDFPYALMTLAFGLAIFVAGRWSAPDPTTTVIRETVPVPVEVPAVIAAAPADPPIPLAVLPDPPPTATVARPAPPPARTVAPRALPPAPVIPVILEETPEEPRRDAGGSAQPVRP